MRKRGSSGDKRLQAGGGEPLLYGIAFGLEASQCGGLHYVNGLGVAEPPTKDSHNFVQGMLDGVGDPVAIPKADKARFGVEIGVLHGGVEVKLHRRSGKELAKAEAESMVGDESRRAAIGAGQRQRGGVPQFEMEGGVAEP